MTDKIVDKLNRGQFACAVFCSCFCRRSFRTGLKNESPDHPRRVPGVLLLADQIGWREAKRDDAGIANGNG